MGHETDVWIGFIHVRSFGMKSALGSGIKGAFTHAVAFAFDDSSFRERVAESLEHHGLIAIDFSDIAPIAEYYAEDRISDELHELAEGLSSQQAVRFCEFDTYDRYD